MSATISDSGIQLSIIIPCKNRHQLLDQLLLEAARQIEAACAASNVELIVVDDGSSPALRAPPLRQNIQLSWLCQQQSTGSQQARMRGFQQSRGRFIHFHDSDDSLGPDWIAAVLNRINKAPGPDLLISARKVISLDGDEFKSQRFVRLFARQPEKLRKRLHYNNCIGPLGGVTFSRTAASRIQFDPLPSSQDWDMYLDALNESTKIIEDSSFYFIKNETQDDRISLSMPNKFMGYMRLGRKHRTFSCSDQSARLFYLYKIKQRFPFDNNSRLQKIYNRNKVAVNLAIARIELIKLIRCVI